MGVELPPQLIVSSAAKRQRLSDRVRLSVRCARPPTNRRQQASIPATGQPDCLCRFVGISPAACAAALIVSIAVVCPFTVSVDGFTLQVMRLEDGAHVKVTVLLNPNSGARLIPTVVELPDCTLICDSCGARVKSGDTAVVVSVREMGALTDSWYTLSPV